MKVEWCSKCSSRIGLSSNEFASITFKGKCSHVKMGVEFKLCARCAKRIASCLKDRSAVKKKDTKIEKIVVLPRSTNVMKKDEMAKSTV